MRFLVRFGSLRTVLAVLTAITALYIGLVAFGNITDFGTNHAFVQHVFAMDTTFKSPETMWRAISSPGLATAAYVGIIVWETLSAIVLTAALVAWVRGAAVARSLSSLGWLMLVLLFAGGFITIGGEWFQMWQSKAWNGLQSALQNFLVAALGLILVHLPERDTGTA
jgi:predicted small integral membrane protein